MKRLKGILLCLMTSYCLSAQSYYFPKLSPADSVAFSKAITATATYLINHYKNDDRNKYLDNLFRLQVLTGRYAEAGETIVLLRNLSTETNPAVAAVLHIQHELYAKAKNEERATDFNIAFAKQFRDLFSRVDDKTAVRINTAFTTLNGLQELRAAVQQSWMKIKDKDSLETNEALDLCRQYYLFQLYKDIEPLSLSLLKEDDNRRYIIEDSVLIKTKKGVLLSAIVVRKRSVTEQQPTALAFTIYAEDYNLQQARIAAANGYVGIVAHTRGKGLSHAAIVPYECEAEDVNEVIDWISRQAWSNGKVGMYGGSYNGFSQWAALKHPHPALKTIVPYVAAIPGLGVPMENNVFINANYGWAFYVTNNKYLDDSTYYDPQRWAAMENKWYESGVAYRSIDSIDGKGNYWLQRWLKHPAFDRYWQNMIPFQKEYASINIPILSITGYYDDGQISALHYFREHYKFNKNAEHYLLIGPYDHVGAQRGGTAILRDYAVDPVALINTREITFQWLDYILKGGPRPTILQDKINYELMGANEWRHAPSLDKGKDGFLTLYLTDKKAGQHFLLSPRKPTKQSYLLQEVDLADRRTSNNTGYYPYPIIEDSIDLSNGLSFITEPFDEPVELTGSFIGELKASINKKDMDIGVVLYELMPDGRYFHLSYFLGRASFAKDMTRRQLLTPGKTESIPFERTRMVSRQLGKGSRLLVVLNINKNPYAQVNYGTGKDVSDETIADAKQPLKIKWFNDSFIKVPIWK